MTVATVVLGAVYATLSTSLQAWKRAEALGEESQTARAALDLISRDLRASVRPGLTEPSSTEPSSSYLRFLGQEETVDGNDTVSLEFAAVANAAFAAIAASTSTADATSAPRGLIRVRYRLEDGAGLARSVFAAWVGDSGEGHSSEEDAVISPLIRAVAFRYFDGTEWLDSWNSSITGGLPQQVEITVKIGRAEDPDAWKTYRTIAALPAARGETAGDTREMVPATGGGSDR